MQEEGQLDFIDTRTNPIRFQMPVIFFEYQCTAFPVREVCYTRREQIIDLWDVTITERMLRKPHDDSWWDVCTQLNIKLQTTVHCHSVFPVVFLEGLTLDFNQDDFSRFQLLFIRSHFLSLELLYFSLLNHVVGEQP
ncbi:hypothetical protein D3C80_1106960 [compost metagenome]